MHRKLLNKDVWRLATPAIFANLTVPLVGIVDTWALGHLGDPAFLGAIAVASVIFNSLYWSLGFLRMGTTGLTAQASGAGDETELARLFGRAALLALLLGAGLLIVSRPLGTAALALMGAAPREESLARQYFEIRIWSAPFTLLTFAVTGWLIGSGRIGIAMALQVALNLINALLNGLFVAVMGLGVAGAALGSLIAESLIGVIGAVICLEMLGGRNLWRQVRNAAFWNKVDFRRLMAVNRDIFIRTVFLIAAFWLYTDRSAGLGTISLAGNQVLLNFVLFVSFTLDGFAYAAEILVGRAVGAANRAALLRAAADSLTVAGVTAILLSLGFLAFGELAIGALTDLEAVRGQAESLLPFIWVFPVVAVWSYQFDGIFIGATRTPDMMWTMIAAFAVYIVLLAVFVPAIGATGVWIAFLVFMLARGVGLAARFPALARRVPECVPG